MNSRRRISDIEAMIVRETIDRAAVQPVSEDLLSAIPKIQVVGRCGCGCATVDFEGQSRESYPIAEGTGTTPSGGTVGVIVWGTSNAITGLEVYDLGAGSHDLELPVPGSIHSWKRQMP